MKYTLKDEDGEDIGTVGEFTRFQIFIPESFDDDAMDEEEDMDDGYEENMNVDFRNPVTRGGFFSTQ